MSLPPALDLRVAIERVRVRTGARPGHRPPSTAITGYLTGRTGAGLHDHRITIRELRIEIEAALDASAARALGHAIARELASRLDALQDRRQPTVVAAPTTGGPIHVEALRIHLRGEPARHPTSHQICQAAMTAFEAEVHDAT